MAVIDRDDLCVETGVYPENGHSMGQMDDKPMFFFGVLSFQTKSFCRLIMFDAPRQWGV